MGSKLFPNKKTVDILYSRLKYAIFAPIFVVFALSVLLQADASETWHITWVGANSLMIIARAAILSAYRWSRLFRNIERSHRGLFITLVLGLSGLVLGLTSLLLFPESIPLRFFILLMLGGLVCGAVATYSASLIVYFAYALPVMSLFPIRMILSEDRLSTIAGLLSFAFFTLLSILALLTHQWHQHSLMLDRENRRLYHSMDHRRHRYRELLQEAETTNRTKSDFLANMTHEIRTPINAVIGFTDLLVEMGGMDEKRRDYLEMIRVSARTLLDIINDILDFSKIESGQIEFDYSPFAVRELMEGVSKSLYFQAIKRSNRFHLRVDDSVPRTVVSDSVKVRQILVNLANNANKFTENGTVTISCTARNEGEDRFLLFSVEDTGIGIATDRLESIFERFTQEDGSTTRRYGGTGLGLSISKYFVEELGGEIWVRSTVGEGSTFSFTIPLRQGEEETLEALEEVKAEESLADRASGVRVLLVDDDDINLKLGRINLETIGFSVDTAENGKEALEKWRSIGYTFVFLDVQMPVMDGYEAARAIRAEETKSRGVRIIALTASSLAEEIEKCYTVGMDDFVSKPIDRDRITTVVKKYS